MSVEKVTSVEPARRPLTATTVAEAIDIYLGGLRNGSVLRSSNRPYKPAAIEKYRHIAEKTLKPELGRYTLSEVQASDVHRLTDKLQSAGVGKGTIHATLDLLRSVYREAIERGEVATDPIARRGQPTHESSPASIAMQPARCSTRMDGW